MLVGAREVTVRDPRGGSRPVALPSAIHLFAHGCLHFAWAHVMRTGLVRWAADLRALAADPGFDWPAAIQLMREARAATTAYWALRVVEAAGLWEVPTEVMRALAPRRPEALQARLARHFLTRLFVAESALLPARVDQLLWSLAIQPGASGHGRERPWTRDAVSRRGQEAGAPATPLRFPEPPLPGAVRGRLAARYLWRLARATEPAARPNRGVASRAR